MERCFWLTVQFEELADFDYDKGSDYTAEDYADPRERFYCWFNLLEHSMFHPTNPSINTRNF